MKRVVRIFSPFLLLVLLLLWVNVDWSLDDVVEEQVAEGVTAVSTSSLTPTLNPTMTPPPTVTPLPSATAYLPPVFPATATIELIGPPATATFATQDTVSFYWRWSMPLTDDQQFVLYGVTPSELIPLATVTETTLGETYFARVALPEKPLAGWIVQLETNLADVVLLPSPVRPLQSE